MAYEKLTLLLDNYHNELKAIIAKKKMCIPHEQNILFYNEVRYITPVKLVIKNDQLGQLLEEFQQQYNSWQVPKQIKVQDDLLRIIQELATNLLDNYCTY
ncbi:26146_t:CDS:2 [Gigaspora margarita]|uniref:26146_t:CDS:1 n=1 Tax=Gigaspora margarita TaxID=4874 RepID=A0ABM8W201_GIGMA|nr:26146_t:CDS:2 [Gigaspora margarita]